MPPPNLNRGALAPVTNEVIIDQARITGTIPVDLTGVLVRNGPNPLSGRFEGEGVLSWWPEAVMLHGIAFADGRMLGYRNRWLQTRRWAELHDRHNAAGYEDTNPNVNVVRHAGEVMALAEGAAPLLITPELATLGVPEKHTGFAHGMSAHPKVDPVTGEMMAFRSSWQAPWLLYGVFGPDGTATSEQAIDIPAPSMMHDLAVTQTHSVLMDLPVGYDLTMIADGFRLPLRWHEERPARLGLIPRHGGAVSWFEVEPCFVQHVVNAYDRGDSCVVVDVVRYPWYLRLSADGKELEPDPLGVLWRYELDLVSGKVAEQQLHDRHVELPRINDARTGRHYRYLYAVEQPTDEEMRGVVRYDHEQGTLQRFELPRGDQNSEPVFVPSENGQAEDDGYVLVCVYRARSQTSDVVILDGRDIRQVLATVALPRRIPAGFHGTWLSL